MQADFQPRQASGALKCIGGGGRGDHQARGAEHAFAMALFDCGIHLGAEAKIVGGEDDLFHVFRDAYLLSLQPQTRESL